MPRAAKKSLAAPMTSPPPAAKKASQEEDLTALSRKELQQLAKDLGLKANAKNAELIEAIQKAQKPESKKQKAEPAAAVSAVKVRRPVFTATFPLSLAAPRCTHAQFIQVYCCVCRRRAVRRRRPR
jgi:hypothetical protein